MKTKRHHWRKYNHKPQQKALNNLGEDGKGLMFTQTKQTRQPVIDRLRLQLFLLRKCTVMEKTDIRAIFSKQFVANGLEMTVRGQCKLTIEIKTL